MKENYRIRLDISPEISSENRVLVEQNLVDDCIEIAFEPEEKMQIRLQDNQTRIVISDVSWLQILDENTPSCEAIVTSVSTVEI